MSDDVSPPARSKQPRQPRQQWDETVRRRFWAKVQVGEAKQEACREWQGALSKCGYGSFKLEGRTHYAHRVAWLLSYGPIPKGQYILHKCDNLRCCHLAHLFLGSPQDNLRDASEKQRLWQNRTTHCPQGHPYIPSNTYQRANGWRECRTCRRERKRQRAA